MVHGPQPSESGGRLAIVGLAYRFPGADGESFWQALLEGRSLVTAVDGSRWSLETYHHPRPTEPGRSYTFAAGTLGDVSGFDAAFFGISPREAAQMDPQQRLLLELAWEALESGGIRPSSMRGSRGAVLIGFSGSDYAYRHADDFDSADAFLMTGCTASIAANRISYFLDLRGPSIAVDTACSSALTALHLACRAVLDGEADFALAGAVNLLLHPLAFIGFSKASMLSRRGACRAFDAAGDGYVRSEGGAIVALKPLERALADRNRIFAVVSASVVNCDGRTPGLTVPSAAAQAALLREAYARAGVNPAEVDYVEAHGTGTPVGDPIEAAALGEALGKLRPAGAPLPIGSVKTNIGHLEAAAGMAGLVKAIHCLRHRMLPPSIHFGTPNPEIPFESLNLAVVREPQPLPSDRKLVIGVNSFGFGGANGHVVLESAPAPESGSPRRPDRAAPLILSARSAPALKALAARYADWLRRRDDLGLYEIAYSAAFHRDWHAHRAIFPEVGRSALAAELERFASGEPAPAVATGRALARAEGPVFVYTGNGSQWAGMGRRLLEEDEVFRAAVAEVDRHFAPLRSASLLRWMSDEQSAEALERTEVAQPLLFAVQVGITEMLRARGIAPIAVLGHSVGEIAAAWACGALALEHAVEVVAQRSAWQETTRDAGAMMAVQLGEAGIRALLATDGLADRIEIAALNSPHSVTVAGGAEDLDALETALRAREITFTRLALRYAFHSRAMDAIEAPIGRALAHVRPRPGTIRFHSTVTGGPFEGERLDAAYWWRNIREPVRFEEAVRRLREAGATVFVEIGPQPILGRYVRECLGDGARECAILPTMARKADDRASVLRRAYEIVVTGCTVDLSRLFPHEAAYVDLPTYPWQRERHWYEPTPESLGLLDRRIVHPLLGYRLRQDGAVWENRLDTQRLPALADHRVGGAVVFPAAGFVEMALAAAAELHATPILEIEELAIHAPLVLEAEHSRTIRFEADPEDGRFTIRSRLTAGDQPWRIHASGRLPHPPSAPLPAEAFEPQAPESEPDPDAHYRQLAEVGLDYGPAFRPLREIRVCERSVEGSLAGEPSSALFPPGAPTQLDPAALDACFQLLLHLVSGLSQPLESRALLPVGVGHLQLMRPGVRPSHVRISERRRAHRTVVADCWLYAQDGSPVAALHEVQFRALPLREGAGRLLALREHAVPMPLAATRERAPLPPTPQLLAACAARLHGAARLAARRRYYERVEPLLEALLGAFARDAIAALSKGLERATADRLLAAGVVPHRNARRLDLLLRLAANGDLPSSDELWRELLADHPDHTEEIIRIGRLGLHLADLVKGTLTVERLFPEEADSAAGCPVTADFAGALAELLARALESLPATERLRVLVAGETGARFAGAVLAAMDPNRTDCVFACRDAGAREALAAEFSRRHRASFVECDFSRARELPREIETRFDIVLYGAGPFGAGDSEAELGAIRARLAGDALLAVFVPLPSRTAALIAGLVHDAQAAEVEPENAPGKTWWAMLERCGYTPQGILADLPAPETGPFAILARAPVEAAPIASAAEGERPPAHWLVVSEAKGFGAEVAEQLAAELLRRGCPVHRACRLPGTPFSWSELIGQSRALHGELAGIVELCALGPGARNLSPADRLERQVERCLSLGELFEACAATGLRPTCWIVTSHAAATLVPPESLASLPSAPEADDAPVWGHARVAANEYPALGLRLVDFAEGPSPETVKRFADCLLHDDGEEETVLTARGRFALRLRAQPLAALSDTDASPSGSETRRLELAAPGTPRNLVWVRRPIAAPSDGEVEIEVHAAGLNFRDVMLASGQLDPEATSAGFAGAELGMEIAGTIAAVGPGVRNLHPGDRVLALAAGGFSGRVITRASTAVPIPEHWSFEMAAGIPVAFLTAYYALDRLARLAEGERVLIHGAAGGVGLAAVQIARLAGAEIFATAGSEKKRDVLRLLGVEHVFNSRTPDFSAEVLARTGGRGVDVVLNSLAGEAMVRSLRLLAPFGRFLELGKRDYYANTRVGLRPFRNNIAYFGIDLDQLVRERPAFVRSMMRSLMNMFEEGALRPLPWRAFTARHAGEAFRYMQHSRHIGKIVLTLDELPATEAAPAARRPALRLAPDATYLVTGGLGGLGLRTARWLAERGARNLVLVGRRGPADEAARAEIAALRATGLQVLAEACDCADHAAMRQLFARIRTDLPPLRGVVHAAGTIEDGLVRNLGREQMRAVLGPKVLGALNLDRLTRGAKLDFFVLFSSATTALGNPGQSNYVAANRFLEALAERRRAAGEPALCVGWGPVADAGYLARNRALLERLVGRTGIAPMTTRELFGALEALLCAAAPAHVLAVIKAENASLGRLAMLRARRFADFAMFAPDAPAVEAEDIARWLEELDDEALAARLTDLLRKEIGGILRLAPERLDTAQPLQDLGMDSLMGVELLAAIEARFGVAIPPLAVAELGSIQKLAARLAAELRRAHRAAAPAPDAGEIAQAQRLAAQYSSELSAEENRVIAKAIEERRAATGEARAP